MTAVSPDPLPQHHEEDVAAVDRLRDALNSVLRGKSEIIEKVLTCLLARGHLLLEDKPGLGKTTLAKALAAFIGGQFARMQCTPDLLPSDITGFSIFNQKTHEFEFRPGPVFSDILLSDEINRATPRSQSALLEAMAERQVTVDTQKHSLSEHFFVIATQNPIDQHGTYPLPEAQLDRFAMKLSIGYPDSEDEVGLLRQSMGGEQAERIPREAILAAGQLDRMQTRIEGIAVTDAILAYLVRLANATRQHPRITLGVSPRGLLIWLRSAQARAFLEHRDYVLPEDVQDLAVPILSVRLGVETDDPEPIVREILDSTPLPDYSAVHCS
jgi:MoxR-like ATPase